MTEVLLSRLSYTYRYKARHIQALRDVSVLVESGELMAILGPSGGGKTTLLRLIAGLQQPTSGDILFDGYSVKKVSARKRGVMMVFQDEQLFPYMTVFQNIAFGLKSQHISGKALRKRVAEVLELVQMTGYEKRLPSQLSGGEQQRIALARAIAVQPKVLLLDEPLSHLDANLREQLREMVRYIQQHLKITMLFVTHDQHEALSIADRVGILMQGALQQVAMPNELLQNPSNIDVARFLGMPNIFCGQKSGRCLRTTLGDFNLSGENSKAQDGEVYFVVPTTAIQPIFDSAIPQNCLTATVVHQQYYYHRWRYTLKIADVTFYMDYLMPCEAAVLDVVIDPMQIKVYPKHATQI
ncbi:MAG: polyamine ABC transporter ATP-binding protein [Phototrophicales bacterium]|nr:MAG: polyamine ABC transporter ATP-binding protein [Phototrophicales bacterium]